MYLMGNMEWPCMLLRGIGPHLAARGKSHGFSHVAAGTWGTYPIYGRVAIQNSWLFRDVSTLSSYEGHLRNLHEAWLGNTEGSPGEARD